jgi:hypothetical protein
MAYNFEFREKISAYTLSMIEERTPLIFQKSGVQEMMSGDVAN